MATPLFASLATGGETLTIQCDVPWLVPHIVEGADGQLREATSGTIHLHVEADRQPFPIAGWTRTARDVWGRPGQVLIRDVATSGLDVLLRDGPAGVEIRCRWRPPARTRAAAVLLRTRWRLIVRSVLLQYPVLWAAGLRGRAPLHACAVRATSGEAMLIVGPSGVGKTTVIEHEVAAGGCATTDNLCLADGRSVWGLIEPVRSENGTGRRAPHGRHEGVLARRTPSVEPGIVVVLERGARTEPRKIEPAEAARAIAASTYAAGELRRYWPFHAQVALGTGGGSAHPPVTAGSAALCARLPCVRVTLARARDVRLAEVLAGESVR